MSVVGLLVLLAAQISGLGSTGEKYGICSEKTCRLQGKDKIDCTNVACNGQDVDQWWAVVNTVMSAGCVKHEHVLG
jgi:hypothetical protein